MLTIVCGEDTIGSRDYFQKIKEECKSKGYEVVLVPKADVETIRSYTTETASLFAPKRAFFTEHLVKHLKKSRSKSVLEEIQSFMKQDFPWFDWEDYQAREITNPKGATLKEFKAPTSIFKLLDLCVPGNKLIFLQTLNQLSGSLEEGFIYTMLWKHVRSLVVAKSDGTASAIPAWQRVRIVAQAKQWDTTKLIGLYEGLARIDQTIKTSGNPYGIKKSLDILACYFL